MLRIGQVCRSKLLSSLFYGASGIRKQEFATLSATACCYDVLGVNKTATSHEIKEAYLKLVKKYHPDHNTNDPDAEENFKVVSRAYEMLKDPITRSTYDSSINPNPSAHYHNSQTYTAYRRPSRSTQEYYARSSQDYYGAGYQEYSKKYQEEYEQAQKEHYRSMRAETNTVLAEFLGKICLGLMLVVALQYMFSTKNKVKTESKRPVDKLHERPSKSSPKHDSFTRTNEDLNRMKHQRANTVVANSFGELAANNPLIFVRERVISPEMLQQEIAKKQFRIEYTVAVVRGPPEMEAMKKKWSKEKVVKNLDKAVKSKGFELKKSNNRRNN